MSANKKADLQGLVDNIEKAVRRGKKLEKTLLKIVAQSEPGSAAEQILKSVQQTLKSLKKEAKKAQQSPPPTAAKTNSQPAPEESLKTIAPDASRAANRSRKKAPAVKDQSSDPQQPNV